MAPLVSILCLVYNHEKFLDKALNSFVKQETSFQFEVIVHDDASTDNSSEIIRKFADTYPEIIKPIFQFENQHSKRKGVVTKIVNQAAQGKYIAMCDGDDFWTDSYKLQKQVDFLESHPNYTLCCGGFIARSLQDGSERTVIRSSGKIENQKGFSFGLFETTSGWLTKTLTILYRRSAIDINVLGHYNYTRDIHLFYHILKSGPGFYFSEVLGVFNIHPGGINSMQQGRVNANAAYNSYRELYEHNRDEFTRVQAIKSTINLLNYDLYNKYPGNTLAKRFRLFKEAFLLAQNIKEFKFLINAFVKREVKDKFKKTATE